MTMKLSRKSSSIKMSLNNMVWDLPSPSSMTYMWNFGSTLGFCLTLQILTGLFLTFHYTSYAQESFASVVHLMRDVWWGWMIRLIHMNNASMFFFFIYLHLFRGMYYNSFKHTSVWMSGVTILIVMMAISFLGYVLPWGQMSYWAVAVITNLFSVIPIIGDQVVYWIWGGFSVGAPTLTRFYSLHFLLPFILAALVIVHLISLHEKGSSNSLGIKSSMDKVQFHPYFTVKDFTFILLAIAGGTFVSAYYPYILGDSINNVPANAMQTPPHIQPEWYFLTSYAILRSVPNKTAGVISLMLSVSIFYMFPLFNHKFSTKFSWQRTILYWIVLTCFVFLMKMGAMPAEEPWVTCSATFSFMYFISLILLNI